MARPNKFIIPDQRTMFLKTKIARLEKRRSCASTLHARTWETAFVQEKSLDGNFVLIACAASFSPLLIFFEAIP